MDWVTKRNCFSVLSLINWGEKKRTVDMVVSKVSASKHNYLNLLRT